MEPDPWILYRQMLRSRKFEEAVMDLYARGEISGEMHMGMGEEAVIAGVVAHLSEGDAMALDHRSTPPLVVRGADLIQLLRELLGQSDGLCSGIGGHMHLFSPEQLTASSGIVGASGPTAVGFALAAQHLRAEKLAVAFFGEGAMNQGMLLESMNLAVAWKLPVLFVCKDNAWAITTRSASVTGGNLLERARGFGMPAEGVEGLDVEDVWRSAGQAVDRARNGDGPTFLLCRCVHLEGHFLGDPFLRLIRTPVEEAKQRTGPLFRSALAARGSGWRERLSRLGTITSLIGRVVAEQRSKGRDPLWRTRRKLQTDAPRLEGLEKEVDQEINQAVETALSRA